MLLELYMRGVSSAGCQRARPAAGAGQPAARELLRGSRLPRSSSRPSSLAAGRAHSPHIQLKEQTCNTIYSTIYTRSSRSRSVTSLGGLRTWVHRVSVCTLVPNPVCICRRLCQLLPDTSLHLGICPYHDIRCIRVYIVRAESKITIMSTLALARSSEP